jgi:mannan polymerase complexes MNN9 subunit
MARARTYLLTATLEPSVDWVLWIDSDISEISPTIFQDLLIYGKAGVLPSQSSSSSSSSSSIQKKADSSERGEEEWNDVIVPNAMKRLPDGTLHGFDMNNWSETPQSLKLKKGLKPDHLLIEGNIWQHMHRIHLADMYVPYTTPESGYVSSSSSSSSSSSLSSSSVGVSTSNDTQGLEQVDSSSETGNEGSKILKIPNQPEIFSSSPAYLSSISSTNDQRLNVTSPAYIGKIQELDGIGGVAALVRAEVHRMGATFPSWIFENQLETEAFGVLAKRLGARVVGLPNLFVLHGEFSYLSIFSLNLLLALSLSCACAWGVSSVS